MFVHLSVLRHIHRRHISTDHFVCQRSRFSSGAYSILCLSICLHFVCQRSRFSSGAYSILCLSICLHFVCQRSRFSSGAYSFLCLSICLFQDISIDHFVRLRGLVFLSVPTASCVCPPAFSCLQVRQAWWRFQMRSLFLGGGEAFSIQFIHLSFLFSCLHAHHAWWRFQMRFLFLFFWCLSASCFIHLSFFSCLVCRAWWRFQRRSLSSLFLFYWSLQHPVCPSVFL